MLLTGGLTAMALLNRYFENSVKSEDGVDDPLQRTWNFREFSIRYSVMGEGKPILMIHDIGGHSSSVEWLETTPILSRKFKVYTLDLIGFGFSDKPVMTYTGYLFADLIVDFIREVIGEKTDIIASGQSAGVALSVKEILPDSVGKIILVNPSSPVLRQPTEGIHRAIRSVYRVPVIGTMFYNFTFSRLRMEGMQPVKMFYRPQNVSKKLIHAFYRNSRRHEKGAISVFTSRINNLFAVPTGRFVRDLRDLTIIYGKYYLKEFPILHKYKNLNSHILFAPIDDSRQMPQVEMPDVFAAQVEAIL